MVTNGDTGVMHSMLPPLARVYSLSCLVSAYFSTSRIYIRVMYLRGHDLSTSALFPFKDYFLTPHLLLLCMYRQRTRYNRRPELISFVVFFIACHISAHTCSNTLRSSVPVATYFLIPAVVVNPFLYFPLYDLIMS
jgi:hypothetical protein